MFTKYLLPGLGVALALALAATAIQTARVGKFKAVANAANAEVSRLLGADASKEVTLGRLQESIKTIRAEAKAQGEALLAAASAVEASRATITKQAAELAAAEAKDYDNPNCQALLAVDLYSTCPAHAAGMRERASRRLP